MRFHNSEGTIIDAGNGVFIPADPDNRDYAEIVATGVEIEPYEAPALVFESVETLSSRAEFREPTKKELQAQLDEIQAQIARLP